jgi:hypothetical protein
VAELSTRGGDAFLRLSKRMKAAGQTELRKELHRAMRNAAKPLIPQVREAARGSLPKRGGLNERIARKPYRAQVRTGAKTAGVRIAGSKVDPRINQGRVWHPVFGRRLPIPPQQVPAARGYFDDTLRGSGPAVRNELRRTLVSFAEQIAAGF